MISLLTLTTLSFLMEEHSILFVVRTESLSKVYMKFSVTIFSALFYHMSRC